MNLNAIVIKVTTPQRYVQNRLALTRDGGTAETKAINTLLY